MPGDYTVSISKEEEGKVSELAGPVSFKVVKLFEGALKGMEDADALAFRKDVEVMREALSAALITLSDAQKKLNAMETALSRMPQPVDALYEEYYVLKRSLADFREQVYGDPAKQELSEYDYPSVDERLGCASGGAWNLNYGPTGTQVKCLELAKAQFETLKTGLKTVVEDQLPSFEKKLIEAGAPWMNGMPLK